MWEISDYLFEDDMSYIDVSIWKVPLVSGIVLDHALSCREDNFPKS